MENEEKLVTLTVVHNGPYIIEGKFKMIDKDGREVILNGKNAMCRCGHSHRKPYCDGTHLKIHFDDTAQL